MHQEASKPKPFVTLDGIRYLPETVAIQRQLEISEERYRTMVELAREGMVVLDPRANITFVNRWLTTLLGYSVSEMQGRRIFDFIAPKDHELVRGKLERRRHGLSDVYELDFITKEGRTLTVLISAAPLMINEQFLGSLTVVTDISHLKEVEAELRAAKDFQDTVINSITDSLIAIDPHSCWIVLANEAFLQHLGAAREEVVNRPCYEVMHRRAEPCRDEGIYCPVQDCARLKKPVVADKSFKDSQGRTLVYQIAAYPHFNVEGEVDLVISLERDVTDRRKMEENLAFHSRELQKTQMQLEKLSEVARERFGKRSLLELVYYLRGKIQEAFPESEGLFLILDPRQRQILPLEECPPGVTDPLGRFLRRLEQTNQAQELVTYLSGLREQPGVVFPDRGSQPPGFRILSEFYSNWFGLPLFAKQQCLGFFVLGSVLPQGYSREDVNFVQALFAQVNCYLQYLLRRQGDYQVSGPVAGGKTAYDDIIGQSKRMQEIYGLIDLLAGTDATVLITGENGTGKELVARTIHRRSKRGRGPFVVANCSAYSSTLLESELFGHERGAFTGAIRRKKGRFEMADGGTLFLDEIGDIPPATQVLLLRFLQDHCFERVGGEVTIESDVRVLAATNKDLYGEVQAGRFRDDLYYRLNVITIHLPPLRERKEDIPLLCQHFLSKYNVKENKKIGKFSPDAMQTLMDYDWPGNVRQLENAISHAVILAPGEMIRRRHLPRFLREATEEAAPTTLEAMERRLIQRVLEEARWNKYEAAKRLGITRSTLYSKIARYGLTPMSRDSG